MRSISTALMNILASEEARAAWLLSLAASGTTYHYTDADVPIVYSGSTYVPIGMRVARVGQTAGFSADSVEIEIDNVERQMSAIVFGGDVIGSSAVLRCIFFDASTNHAMTVYSGRVSGYSVNESMCTIECGSAFDLWHKQTMRLPTRLCPWVYRGTECGYAGPSTACDKSIESCLAHGNSSRFGGRPFILDLETREIYWGPR